MEYNRGWKILLYLIEHRHRVVTRKELLERFWQGREVYAENLTGAIYLDKPSEITVYGEVWESITAKALEEPASIAFMSSVLKELNDRESA